MNIRPFEISDINQINIEDSFKGFLRSYVENYGQKYARIGEVDGKPVFACGITPFWQGVGEIWIRVFDKSHAIGIIRAVKEQIGYLITELDFHRIQSTVRADDEQTLKFNHHIGLKTEAILSEYYPDKCDAVILRYIHA